jgi:hypothetical protein
MVGVTTYEPQQDAEKVALLTRPTPARRDAPFPMQRSRIVQILNVEEEFLGGRKHSRCFSVRQYPLQERTAHTKCGMYLLGPSLAAALLDGPFEHPRELFSW